MARHEAAGRHVKAPKAPRPKNKKARKIVAIVLVCSLLLGGAGTGVFMYLRSRGAGVNVYPVNQLMQMPDIYSQNQTDGNVTTDRMQSVYLSSTQTVTEVFVTEGQEVSVGDPILSFDTTLNEVQLEKARINLEQTKLDLQDAENMLKEIATYKVGSPGGYGPEETPEPSPVPPDPPGFQFGQGTADEPYVFLWRDGMLLNEATMDALAQIAYNANHPDETPSEEPDLPPSPEVTTAEDGAEAAMAPIGLRPVGVSRPGILRVAVHGAGRKDMPGEVSAEPPVSSPPEQAVTPEPEITPEPELTPEPAVTPESEITPEPELTPEPAVTPEPEITPEPELTPEPAATPEPEITPEPETTPEPTASPTPTPDPTPSAGPSPDASGEPSEEMKPDCEYYMVFEIRFDNSLTQDVRRAYELHMWRADGIFSFEVLDPVYTPVLAEPDEDDDGGFFFDSTQYYTADEIAKMKRETESQILQLQIDLKLAEQDLKVKEYEISNGEVFAEVAGTVKTIREPEEALSTGEAMVVISGGGGYIIRAAMGEFDLNTLHVGDMVQVSDWRSGGMYGGTITEISEYPTDSNQYWYYSQDGNQNVTLYPFTVSVSEEASLRENYGVTIYLPSNTGETDQSGIYLQSMFIRSEGGRSYIYVARDGVLKKQYVTTGRNLWGSYLEVRGGLTEDDYVAFPYGRNVKEGAPVIIREDTQSLYE